MRTRLGETNGMLQNYSMYISLNIIRMKNDIKVKRGDIIGMFLVFKRYFNNYAMPPTIMTGSASFYKN